MMKSCFSNLTMLENILENMKRISEVNDSTTMEHTAIKDKFEKLYTVSHEQLEDTGQKMQDLFRYTFCHNDISTMKSLLQNKKKSFDKKWKENDQIIQQNLEFKKHESKLLSMLKEVNESLQKLNSYTNQKNSQEKELESHLKIISETINHTQSKIEELLSLVKEGYEKFPSYADKISSELLNLDKQQKVLGEAVAKQEEKHNY